MWQPKRAVGSRAKGLAAARLVKSPRVLRSIPAATGQLHLTRRSGKNGSGAASEAAVAAAAAALAALAAAASAPRCRGCGRPWLSRWQCSRLYEAWRSSCAVGHRCGRAGVCGRAAGAASAAVICMAEVSRGNALCQTLCHLYGAKRAACSGCAPWVTLRGLRTDTGRSAAAGIAQSDAMQSLAACQGGVPLGRSGTQSLGSSALPVGELWRSREPDEPLSVPIGLPPAERAHRAANVSPWPGPAAAWSRPGPRWRACAWPRRQP